MLLADLSSQEAVRQLARAFKAGHDQLHVLINNAGAVNQTRRTTADGLELTFAVNHLAYFLLTVELLDLLRATPGARVVNVASSAERTGRINFADLHGERRYGSFTAYSPSKLANVLFTYELARRLWGSGVSVNALHPGAVASNFGGEARGFMGLGMRLIKRFGSVSPQQGARTVTDLANSPQVEGVSGKYFVKGRPASSSRASYDEAVARRLWDVSEQLTRAAQSTF